MTASLFLFSFLFPFKLSSNLAIADLTVLTIPRCWFWVLMNFCKGAHTHMKLRRGRQLAMQIAIGLFASTPVQWRWMGILLSSTDWWHCCFISGWHEIYYMYILIYSVHTGGPQSFYFLGQMFWHRLDWHESLQSSCSAFLFCLNDLRPLYIGLSLNLAQVLRTPCPLCSRSFPLFSLSGPNFSLSGT